MAERETRLRERIDALRDERDEARERAELAEARENDLRDQLNKERREDKQELRLRAQAAEDEARALGKALRRVDADLEKARNEVPTMALLAAGAHEAGAPIYIGDNPPLPPRARLDGHNRVLHGEGVCAVCGLRSDLVERQRQIVMREHFPERHEHALAGARTYCRGSAEPPAEVVSGAWTPSPPPDDGPAAVLTVIFAEAEGDKIRQQARSLAARLSERDGIELVHVRTYGTASTQTALPSPKRSPSGHGGET